jgi:hypothetical protein
MKATMATITVEGMPAALLARLRLSAAGSGRSLNSEIIVRLVGSAGAHPGPGVVIGRVGGCCAPGWGCRCSERHRTEAAVNVGWGGPPAITEASVRLRS